jgi:regulator of RNase E activity RraA
VKIPNSVDLPDTVIETMGLYMARSDIALNKMKRYGDRVYFLEASPLEAIDVNYPDDFILANYVAAGMRERERHLFKNLASKITSSVLSDIIDDFGLQTTILGLSLNLKQKKVLGRAKTLKIRALGVGEDYRGIYQALKSYETIVPNDIIVVENQCGELAYFGELNANLAIRSGAIAAIIGGKTRDSSEVAGIDFPVFSTGTVCKDVRNRATVESINKTIEVFGVKVSPNDLVFGDSDGIIVIPKKFEADVLKRVKETISKERTILYDILSGKEIKDILSDNGDF